MHETYLQNERDNRKEFSKYLDFFDEMQGLGIYRFDEKLIDETFKTSLIKVMKALEEELEGEKEMCDKRIRNKSLISPEDVIYGCEQGIQLSIDKIREFIKQIKQ